MAKAEPYVPPPDPDFKALASAGMRAYKRDRPTTVAFDTETSGFNWTDRAFCFQVAWEGPHGTEAHYFEIDRYDSKAFIEEILAGATLIGHNIKFDLHRGIAEGVLKREDLRAARIHDTEALAHLDDEHRDKGLKDLAISVLKYDDTISVEIQSGPNKGKKKKVSREKHELDRVRRKLKLKKADGYHLLPRAVLLPYAVKDAEFTFDLYKELRPRVEQYDDLWALYEQEMKLALVFLDMEAQGLGVDLDYTAKQIKTYQNKVLKRELEIEKIVNKPVGKEDDCFNPNSNPQIAEFFEAAGLARPNYDKDVLKDLDHPLAPALLGLRSDQKIKDTYFLGIQEGQRDGVFHPSIRQHGTVTGRTSSGKERGDSY